MISARGLGAHLPDGRWLFRELDLDARPGEIGVLVGPNGCGKTTLLRCLAGLRAPDAGHVTLANRSLAELGTRERARLVAVLPQSTPIEHDLKVSDLVMLGRTPHLRRFRAPSKQDQARVAAALERVDLQGFGERRAGTLSGGELQRVMIARMLATEAPTLLLDEPTNGLDIGHALGLLELCRELATSGHCIVMALHDLDLACRYADHAVCLGPRSEHHVGPANTVLHPDVLEDVFDVRITLDELGLRCRPR